MLFNIKLLKKQCKNKLEELYLLYKKDMYYTAYIILKDHYEAQDVVQNAIINVSRHLEKINEVKHDKTRAFLIIIVRNLAFNVYNKRKKATVTSLEKFPEINDNQDISLDDHILRLEESAFLGKCLCNINPVYCSILTLRYYYEFKQ